MRPLFALWVLLLSCLPAIPGQADPSLHVIELHHRTAAEIIPILRPLLSGDEAMTGTGYQLIVRATPARLKSLQTVIRQLDKAPQQLRITVRRATRSQMESWGLVAGGGAQAGNVRIYSTDQAGGPGLTVSRHDAHGKVHTRVFSTEAKGDGNDVQQLRVTEGRPAFIQFGLSFPVPEQTRSWVNGKPVVQDGLTYKDIGSGFYALARLQGNRVTLDISPRRQALAPQGGGMITHQALTTTVSGKVGQWLDLGGASDDTRQQDSGTVYRTENRDRRRAHIWVKVDVLK
ncbi:MAG: secretin N-terminal domain-containing protein [Gammaproteobacteria bacterium]